ncbi:hypothetical protein [Sulfitobacter pacificus]|uniref:Uncharacterized protein n=1 Tax=Sulfitobacter pacificus TaxID=1499314 RepID=A0ABQ5VN98_9RHOB|nr:hypothetical protein [Sulfitobacter pacificus]GLQ28660.1 hypothetical protein GCM10007927_34630 [Sulfitobacter pacificus]
MITEAKHYAAKTAMEKAELVFRIVSASLVVVTIHYIGFFSRLTNDYYTVMFPSLVKRIAWELVSTLAFTSMIVAALLLVGGLLKGALAGVLQFSDVEIPEKLDQGYPIDLERIGGMYGMVLAVAYFPSDTSVSARLIFFVTCLVTAAAFYLIFFAKAEGSTKWSRFFEPFRDKGLAVRALIASALFASYFAGQGLASSLLEADPVRIVMDRGDMDAVILATSETTMIVKNDEGLVLLPIHEINKVVFSVD